MSSCAAAVEKLSARPYQRRAIDRLHELLDRRTPTLLVAPTGSGKTFIAAKLVAERSRRVLWLAHRKELVEQAAAALVRYLPVGIIMAGCSTHPLLPCQVASKDTLRRRRLPPAELVVIDEAHHATAASYRTILDGYPETEVLGLTATPFRLDGKGLRDIFAEIVTAATTAQLVDEGWLHAPRVYCHSRPDLVGVRITAGDYNLRQVDERINCPDLVGDIVQTWRQRAANMRTVVFATSIAHSQAIVGQFEAAGVTAEHLDGRTAKDDRECILGRLAVGRTMVVSNCMVLTEGWDLPALQCAVIARPTASRALHLQMLGRIMRAAEGKSGCIVLDHAGNHHVHGSVTRAISYDLSGLSKDDPEPLGLKTCPACFLLVPLAARICPECGALFAGGERNEAVTVAGQLVEYDEDSYEYRTELWAALDNTRLACGYKPGWTCYRYRDRFGDWPLVVYPRGSDEAGELVNPQRATAEQKRLVWQSLEGIRTKKGFKPGWTSHRYRQLFGVWPRGVMSTADRLTRKWQRTGR